MSKKPVWPYRIKKGHPLTKGLVGAWIFDNVGGEAIWLDLINGNHGVSVGTNITNTKTPDGIGVNVADLATTDHIDLGSIDSANPLSCSVNNQMSVVSKVLLHDTSFNNTYPRILHKGSPWDYSFFINGSTRQHGLILGNKTYATSQQSVSTIPIGQPTVIGSSFNGTVLRHYQNGQFDNEVSYVATIPTTAASTYLLNRTDLARVWNDDAEFLWVYNLTLTDDQNERIANDPYLIIEEIRSSANDDIYAALFTVGGDVTLTHELAILQTVGLSFSSNSDTAFQLAIIQTDGLAFDSNIETQFGLGSIVATGLDFTSQKTTPYDVATVQSVGLEFATLNISQFDIVALNSAGLEFYINTDLAHNIGAITTAGLNFTDGTGGEIWLVGDNSITGLQFTNNKTAEFALSTQQNTGLAFQTNLIFSYGISAFQTTGLSYQSSSDVQFEIASITHIGLDYTSFIGQVFDVGVISNAGLTFETINNTQFDIGIINALGLIFDESSIAANINLQFTWEIQQREMQFTPRDRRLNLYD